MLWVGNDCKKVDSKKSKDFYIFRCSKCSTSLTIRTGSILHKFKFPLPKFVKLLHYWAMRTTITDQASILELHRNTVQAFQQYLRIYLCKVFSRENIVLGGENMVVEIDESLFVRMKHGRGKDLMRFHCHLLIILNNKMF